MDLRTTELPSDVKELKRLILAQSEALNKADERIQSLENSYRIEKNILEDKIKDLIARLYSRKSEKLSKFEISQSLLFNEIEQIASQGPELAFDDETDSISVSGHKRNKKGRRSIPDDLPRRERLVDIPEEEKLCSCGAMKTRIGEETSEKIDYIPAEAFVWRIIRPKYVCNCCHGEDDEGMAVSIAPMPPSITGKSILAEGLFGHIIVSKFADALPFYRQEIILRRAGVEISRNTMATLAINVYERLLPLKRIIESTIKSAHLLGIDETRFQVMNTPGRSNTQLSYMWHIRAMTRDGPLPYFTYRPTRSASFLGDFLSGFKGAIITDGYSSYNLFDSWENVTHAGCNSHARRKFVESEKVAPGNPVVKQILSLYQKVYRIEAELRNENADLELILERRQNDSGPLMESLNKLLISLYGNVNPQGRLGNAVSYTLKEWSKLIRFLDNPHIPIDNNFVENGIRPFVLGRKNWLFANTPDGATASAFYFTLIEWTRTLKLDPYLYMSYLFRNAPYAVTENDWKALLPSNIEPGILKDKPSQYAVT